MPTVMNNKKTKSASDKGINKKSPTSGLPKKKPIDEKKGGVSKEMKEQDDDCCSV